MPSIEHRFRAFATTAAFLTLGAPSLWAQAPAPATDPLQQFAPTPAQDAVCTSHNEEDRCPALVIEYTLKSLQKNGSLGAGLDSPWDLTQPFADRILVRALANDLPTAIKQAFEAEKQKAMQLISTSAATNQSGGAPTASGSTNLVTKPTTTDLISAAAESGAFTDTSNGTTTTLQANALGLIKFLDGLPVFEKLNRPGADALEPLNVSVTLNVAGQSSSTAASTTGSANSSTPSITSILLPTNNASFSAVSATYNFYKPYNPQSQAFQKSWQSALADPATVAAFKSAGSKMAVAANALNKIVDPTAGSARTCIAGARNTFAAPGAPLTTSESASFEDFVASYVKFESDVYDCILNNADPATLASIATGVQQAQAAFQLARDNALDKARGTPLATIGYTYATPVQQPATHAFTASVAYLAKNASQMTANFTSTLYASVPAGAAYGRLRDFQASAEFDQPLGRKDSPRATASVAGYGQYQYDPTVLNITSGNLVPGTNITLPSNAQVLLGTAGWLGVVQGKLVINLSKGLTIPIAIKWSNKTDLLQGSDTRGQIGLSYDLSALSSLIWGQN